MGAKLDVEQLRKALRDRKLRATSSRLAVLEYLRENRQPVSHGEIVTALAGPWDPATLYRNLIDLVEAGLARRTDMGDHVWRFEAIDAEHESGHPHFVCTECGVVECLPDVQIVVPRSRTPRAVKHRKVELQLRGRCDSCT